MITLAIAGCNILMIKLATGLIFIIRPLAQNFYVKRKYKINLKEASGNYKIKQKWDGLAQHIAAVIHGNTDITILTIFTTLAEVSVYSVYYLVISGIKKIVQSFNSGIDASFGDMIAKKEDDNLRKKFSSYELLYISIMTIIFATTIILITPFVVVYTKGVNDADYYRPLFGCLLVISEYIWAIRAPYSSITLAAGHFRETRKGAWVEALTNIIISLILVPKFGIVGVTIGTIVAMLIRTIEFTYHANKYILKRSILESVAKITLSVMSIVIVSVIFCFVKLPTPDSYSSWIINAVIVLVVAGVVTLALYYITYGKDLKKILKRGVKLIKRKK